jgi:hypothetical protein
MQPTNQSRQQLLDQIKAERESRHALAEELLANIKAKLDIVEPLSRSFAKSEAEFVYRFYHQSFKVFGYKELIRYAVSFFESLSPNSKPLNSWYRSITDSGLEKEFTDATNENWLNETQPVLYAFWHSRYFVDQMLSAAKTLEAAPPQVLPYDWAAVLYLYDLR